MSIEDILNLLNNDADLQKLTVNKPAQLFQDEDVEPVDDGARIIVTPLSWGDPEEWGSNQPQRRKFSLQVNVESSDLAVSLEVADVIEELFLNNKILRFGDTIADNIEYLYVVARRYRFSTIK